MVLASLGGLDTALREHFSGFASHALLLAALPAVLAAGVLFFAGAPWIAIVLAGATCSSPGSSALRRWFRRAQLGCGAHGKPRRSACSCAGCTT